MDDVVDSSSQFFTILVCEAFRLTALEPTLRGEVSFSELANGLRFVVSEFGSSRGVALITVTHRG